MLIIDYIGGALLIYLAYSGIFVAWRVRAYLASALSIFLTIALGIAMCRDCHNPALAYILYFGTELALAPYFYKANLAKRNRDGN